MVSKIKHVTFIMLTLFIINTSNGQQSWDYICKLMQQDTMHLDVLKLNNMDFLKKLNYVVNKVKRCNFYKLKEKDFIFRVSIKKTEQKIKIHIYVMQNKSNIFTFVELGSKKPDGVLEYLGKLFVFSFYEYNNTEISDIVVPNIIYKTGEEFVIDRGMSSNEVLDRKGEIEKFSVIYEYTNSKFKRIKYKPCCPKRKNPSWLYDDEDEF